MSILPIYITGQSVLHRAAEPVERFDSSLSDLVTDMIDTMHAAPGVGLAAPQIGVGRQVFVWSYRGGGAFDRRYQHILQLERASALGFNNAMSGVVVNPILDLIWDDSGARAICPPISTSRVNPKDACPFPDSSTRCAEHSVPSFAATTPQGHQSPWPRADGSRVSSSTNTTTSREHSTLTGSKTPTRRSPVRLKRIKAGGAPDARGPQGSEPKPPRWDPSTCVAPQWTSKPSERKYSRTFSVASGVGAFASSS